jgi:hypothetical protein
MMNGPFRSLVLSFPVPFENDNGEWKMKILPIAGALLIGMSGAAIAQTTPAPTTPSTTPDQTMPAPTPASPTTDSTAPVPASPADPSATAPTSTPDSSATAPSSTDSSATSSDSGKKSKKHKKSDM